ncbi:tyrosine-type recombinase/integrase [Flavobacterium psychroterrae]|uniref:Tyrosine-type recombinase/integrase n=1 Tax=Flavobacterium psychroterrae TaxID=2133767 RepID=A0ABS5P7B3_9FLAO|nr:site-specific integrase [Flavobacterium psychroterrae]MBS7230205.1 tyrosine-type recombinase/integrase [Flavobacterium psychroterrae]
MQNSEKSTSSRNKSIAFIDYKPAELKKNKEWMIVYYSKHPVTGLLERQRLRVPCLNSITDRTIHAKRIVLEINNKLADGWSPYMEQTGKNYKTFKEVVSGFLNNLNKQLKDNVLRQDTLRTYNSNLNLFQQFLIEKNIKITFAVEINKNLCTKYLDWVYIDRCNSPRTRNNHLIFIKLFCSFLVNRGVLKENPALGIKPMKAPPKTRQVFPQVIKNRINEKLLSYDNGFFCICMTTYFCFIRNTELGKLKVGMVNLKENSIFLPKEISKNKKDEFITIPSQFLEILKNHIGNGFSQDYLFSSDNFKVGAIQMPIRKIATAWEKVREELNLENKYQFYSFKDTGITDLLNSGVPAIKVRDQARHYDIKITELYTPRNKGCDATIQEANVTF